VGVGVVGFAKIDTDADRDTPDEIRCNPLLEFLERGFKCFMMTPP